MGMPNFENRTLFQGDNLPFLQGINSATVDLIATDPPFNKSKDFHATPNSLAKGARFTDRWRWESDVRPEWIDAIQDDWPKAWWVIQAARETYGSDLAAFLCWLGVRLLECRRILKPTGSLYLHIDHTAHAWVKCLLDGIFGRRNFRNELVWWYKNASRGKKRFANAHETILWYSKTPAAYVFNREEILVPFESGMTQWRYTKGGQAGKTPPAGKTPDDVILMPALNTMDKERTGYPTQKPLALYERIIKASSNPGDWVLDPFCGCATTPVAAERLGRQWIGMDLWNGAYQTVLDRLNAEKQIWRPEDVQLATTPPRRTDDADIAAPYLQQLESRREWRPRFSRDEMKAILIKQWAAVCWGCGFEPPNSDDRYFDLDHNLPKSQGGPNDLDNRAILCRPCNGRKGNTLTIEGLRRANRRDGYWYGDPAIDQRIPIKLAVEWARGYLERAAQQAALALSAD